MDKNGEGKKFMKIPHEMILASAGSGKTYSLGVRYIKLLLSGADPSKIAALTFTRKAAGEFLGHILERLALAALSNSNASQLGTDLKLNEFTTSDAQRYLRHMINSMHNHKLGTLDGFFHRIVQCVAPELGLGTNPQLMDSFMFAENRKSVWQKVFRQSTQEEKQRLLHLCLENNWDEEGKQIQKALAEFIDQNHELYLSNPEQIRWNDPYTATNKQFPWQNDPNSTRKIIEHAKIELLKVQWTEAMMERWQNFFACLENEWQWGQPLPLESKYLVEKILPLFAEFESGDAVIKLSRKEYTLDENSCRTLSHLVSLLMGSEFYRSRQHTRMVWLLIDRFERAYQSNVRGAGLLSFSDLPKLLLGSFSSIERELLYFRLDGQIDHWLLDEFQDTSRVQWNAMAEWVDEVIQDPEHRRTFFYVGDVKQSIYGWRGGDPYLFNEIFNHYNPVIQSRRLDLSWRSSPAVLKTVNALFSNFSFLENSFPTNAVTRWKSLWGDHEPSPATLNKTGYSAVWEASDTGLAAKLPAIAEMLQRISPTRRGLSCAILTQRNSEAEEVLQYLREKGLPITREGEMAIASDNDLGTYMLAWFQLAAHPADTFAPSILSMHSIVTRSLEYNQSDIAARADQLREIVYQGGYEQAIREIFDEIEESFALDDFHKLRRRQLLKMAADFDQSNIKDIDKFVSFSRAYRIREASESSSIQVMTIHKSKGLGFDIVVLPSLKSDRLDSMRKGSFLYPGQSIENNPWIFKSPNQIFAEVDPLLRSAMADRMDDACFERFCQFYVATTRAKRALLIVLDKAPKNSTSANFEKWIRASLPFTGNAPTEEDNCPALRYEEGTEEWYHEFPLKDDTITDLVSDNSGPKPSSTNRPEGLKHETATDGDSGIYRTDVHWRQGENAKQMGNRIHEYLASIEWLREGDQFEYPSLREIFIRKHLSTEVWREKAFELRLDDKWISGIFDRVHILKNDAGEIYRATIYDFKTDKVKNGEASEKACQYSHQMRIYGKALACLLKLSPDVISLKLVFLHSQIVLEVKQ